MSAIGLTSPAEYATIIQQFRLRAINSAGECHLHMVEVEGSNPPSPTKPRIRAQTAPFFHVPVSAACGGGEAVFSRERGNMVEINGVM